MEFFKRQAGRRAEKEYLAFDTTSISSYSELIKQVKYGKKKESEALPQIDLGLLYGEKSRCNVMADFYFPTLFFGGGRSPAFAFVSQFPYDAGCRAFRSIQLAAVYCSVDGIGHTQPLNVLQSLLETTGMLHMFQDVAIVQPFAGSASNAPFLILLLCGHRHILALRGIPAKLTGYCALVSPQLFSYGSYGIALGSKK